MADTDSIVPRPSRPWWDPRLLLADLVSALAIALAWWLLSLWLRTPTFPPPLEALRALFTRENGILIHFLVSARRIVLALLLALFLGLPLGLYLGRNHRIDAVVAPFLYLTYPLPKIVLLPVVMVLFGLGDLSRILLIVLTVTYQILVTARDAARALPMTAIYSIRSLGATEFDVYRHVLFPYVLPKVFTALRISSGTAIAVLFFAESFATTSGLGYLIMDAWGRTAYPVMFAAIMAMSGLGLVLYLIFEAAEQRFCRWTLVTRAAGRAKEG
ncbi:MAG: ABC transporter permease subunit [Bacillota bacterium]|nr:ABC transporter permease subunit [Bacillota bacterium]